MKMSDERDIALAVENNDLERARQLLENNPDTKVTFETGAFVTQLMRSISFTNFEMVQLLLDWGVNPNYCSNGFETAFHIAAREGNPKIVQLLLQYHADVNSVTWMDNTALHIGCRFGHEEIVRLLFEAGSDIKRKNVDGNTPLHLACWTGDWKVVEFLVSVGASVDTVDSEGYNPLLSALSKPHSDFKVIELLLEKGTNVNQCNNYGHSSLSIAIKWCSENLYSTDIIDILLKNGFNLKLFPNNFSEIIPMIRHSGQDGILEKLFHAGWTLSINKDNLVSSPLFQFARFDKIELVRLFLATSGDRRKLSWIRKEEIMKIDNPEIRQLLVEWTSETIPSLKHLCRFAIRDSIGFPATSKAATLPLPKTLIDYLQLKSL